MHRRCGTPRTSVPSASTDGRAYGPAGQLAVVVQPPQQQALFLAGRRGAQVGGPGAVGVMSCIERCTAVS